MLLKSDLDVQWTHLKVLKKGKYFFFWLKKFRGSESTKEAVYLVYANFILYHSRFLTLPQLAVINQMELE